MLSYWRSEGKGQVSFQLRVAAANNPARKGLYKESSCCGGSDNGNLEERTMGYQENKRIGRKFLQLIKRNLTGRKRSPCARVRKSGGCEKTWVCRSMLC